MKISLLILALSVAASLPAAADKMRETAISLGVLLPTDVDTRHRTGSALLSGELRYALPAAASANTRTILIGTAATSNRAAEGSAIVSVTAGQVFSPDSRRSPLEPRTAYIGAGVGVYGMDLRFVHAFARVGGYVEAGYNLNSSLFVSTQYRFVDQGSGVSVLLGTRF